MQNRRMNMYRLELDLEGYDPKGWRAAIRREPRPLYIRGKRCLRDIRSGRASRARLYSPMLHDTHKRDGGNPVTRSPQAIPARPRQPASAPSRARATIDAMDQPTPTPKAQDSTLLVTMTAGQLRELVRAEMQAARTNQQDTDRWLDAGEAAKILSMSEDWLYRSAKKLPFAYKLGPKMLRFSYQGMVK